MGIFYLLTGIDGRELLADAIEETIIAMRGAGPEKPSRKSHN